MANYLDANLERGQAKLFGAFGELARKSVNPVTYLAIKRVTEIMVPSHKALRTREDRPIDAFAFKRSQRALQSGRSHVHTGTAGDAGFITPSFNVLSDTFSTSLKRADNSIYTDSEELDNELINSFKNFMEGLESAAIDYIFNNRSEVNIAGGSGIFDPADFVYKITETGTYPVDDTGVTIAQTNDTVMEENDLHGEQLVFCDSTAYDKFNKLNNQGAGNSDNTSFQMGNKTFVRSIKLDDATRFGSLVGTYNKGVWISVPVGSIGHLDWIPQQNRQGIDTKLQTYSSLLNPMDDVDYAINTYPEKADTSATNGQTQDEVLEWETSLDSSFVHAPLFNANETPLMAFALI